MEIVGTLLGVVIGGSIGIATNLLNARYRDFLLRKAIAGSLAGEIEGLLRATERRKYLAALDGLLAQQRNARPTLGHGAGQPIQIKVPVFGPRITFNYFAVFDKTCDKIGLLGEVSSEVALLYTLAKGIVEDMNLVREGTEFPSLDDVIAFHQELRDILAQTIEHARAVIPRLRMIQGEKFLLG